MYRDVKINIPMFIGIILLVAAMTTLLVYLVNITKEYIRQDNEKMEQWFNEIQEEIDNKVEVNDIANEILNDIINTNNI